MNRVQRIQTIRNLVIRAQMGDRKARIELRQQRLNLLALDQLKRTIRRLRNRWIRETYPNQSIVWRRVRRQLTVQARLDAGTRPDQLVQILCEWLALMDRRQLVREQQLGAQRVPLADRRLRAYRRQAIRAQRWLELLQRYWIPTQLPTPEELAKIRNPATWTLSDYSGFAQVMLNKVQRDSARQADQT